jgi:Rha family phage regulatory protein
MDDQLINNRTGSDRIVQFPDGETEHVREWKGDGPLEAADVREMFLALRKPEKSYKTYILKDEASNLYKIGRSEDVETMVKNLGVSNPNLSIIAVFEIDVENELHRIYKSKNVKSEWYSLSEDDVKDIIKSYSYMEKENETNSPQTIVYNEENKALTNSVLVARKFGKKHKHVLESIRNILSTAENPSVLSMFQEATYVNEQNKKQPMYVMNRDGFTMLAMGFTGKQAMNFKVDFIAAFNKMEAIIKEAAALKESLLPKSTAEIILMQAQQLVAQEQMMRKIEAKQQEIEEKVSEIAVRTKTDCNYSTIVGFGKRYGLEVPLQKAATLGRVAINLCRQYQLETGTTPDPRFGYVRTYPDSVLYDTFEKYYPNVRFR